MTSTSQIHYVQLIFNHRVFTSFVRPNILIYLSLFALTGCVNKSQEKTEYFHEGSFIVKARFVDGKREGVTEVYDSSKKLTGILHYKGGILSGTCIHYFSNGVVADSIHYESDKPQGYWRHYNQDGSLKHITYFYFGLQFGPDLWYQQDNVLKNFCFLDFERRTILASSYDSRGHINLIDSIALPIMLDKKEKNGTPLVEFFAYLPQVPLVKHTYYIGISNNEKEMHKLSNIQGENFMIDTVLTPPPPGFHFYLGCDLKAIEGGIDTSVVFTEAIKR